MVIGPPDFILQKAARMTFLTYASDLSLLLLKTPNGRSVMHAGIEYKILPWPTTSSCEGPTSSLNVISCHVPTHSLGSGTRVVPKRATSSALFSAWNVLPLDIYTASSFSLPKTYPLRESFFGHSLSSCHLPTKPLCVPIPPS